MGEFADDLRAGICEAARQMTEARAAGDDYGAEVYRERLPYLRQVALRHSIQPPACPGPAACSEAPGASDVPGCWLGAASVAWLPGWRAVRERDAARAPGVFHPRTGCADWRRALTAISPGDSRGSSDRQPEGTNLSK